jgi:hypothetical protein
LTDSERERELQNREREKATRRERQRLREAEKEMDGEVFNQQKRTGNTWRNIRKSKDGKLHKK